jgi:hypothetical protein
MTRAKVKRGETIEKEIDMSDLLCGQVGHIKLHDRYVLRIGGDTDARFLILDGHDSCNWYDMKAARHNKVRTLRFGEVVHMEFTK